MYKYGIDWYKENATDGGYLDDRVVQSILNIDETRYDDYPEDLKETLLKRSNYFYSSVGKCYIKFDEITDIYYLVIILRPSRRWSSSIITVRVDDPILREIFEETIEIPKLINATSGAVCLVIPTNIKESQISYDNINIKYKDSKQEEYKEYTKSNDSHLIYLESGDEEIIFDKDKPLIEYGYVDYTWDVDWKRIEGIEPYKNEEGVWTSDVVKNPEKYLESHLDWYYSDERVIQYLVNKKVFTEEQANAIRAANYEDIFSIEYKIKHYGFIFLIIFFALIIAIVVRKIIKNRMMNWQ